MLTSFRIWLEADEDYQWFIGGKSGGRDKVRDLYDRPDSDYAHLDPAAVRDGVAAELRRVDPTLVAGLRPQYLNQLVHWLTYQHLERMSHNLKSTSVPYSLSRQWPEVQDFIHAQANNPKFFQALTATTPYGQLAVTWGALRSDARAYAARAKQEGPGDRKGPPGRELLKFSDGHVWVALDKSFCEKEGRAGRHCGNILGQHPDYKNDQVVSLRSPSGEVEATLVVHHGRLAESKGPGNTKIDPRFHPHLAALFLANGPKPLPITDSLFWYKGARHAVSTDTTDDQGNPVTVPPRVVYKPHMDTTVLDLLGSDTVDEETRERLAAKFRHELTDEDVLDGYLDNEMDDAHRKKVIHVLRPEYEDDTKRVMFDRTKQAASDTALRNWHYMIPQEDDLINYRQHAEETVQVLDYNTHEIKRLLNRRWLDLLKHQNEFNYIQRVRELSDHIRDFHPEQFMFKFDPDLVHRRRLYGRQEDADPDTPEGYHPPLEVDNPERRDIQKAMSKFFRAIWDWCQEMLRFVDNEGEQVARSRDRWLTDTYLFLNNQADVIRSLAMKVHPYLKRAGATDLFGKK